MESNKNANLRGIAPHGVLLERWKSDMEGMLVLVSLSFFATPSNRSILGAFLIESYETPREMPQCSSYLKCHISLPHPPPGAHFPFLLSSLVCAAVFQSRPEFVLRPRRNSSRAMGSRFPP